MIRLVNVFAIAVTVMFAFGLYTMKYKTSLAEDQARTLSSKIEEQEDALRILRAEWAYLNRAERLEYLAGQYLNVAPVMPTQIVDVSDVPMRPVVDETFDIGLLADSNVYYDDAPELYQRVGPVPKPISFHQRRQ